MIMACLQIYWELLSLATFLWVHSNSKEVSYLSWQNMYPNLKTTCHIKLKFFLWTKLLENLLLAKYLISVTAPLMAGILQKTEFSCEHYEIFKNPYSEGHVRTTASVGYLTKNKMDWILQHYGWCNHTRL